MTAALREIEWPQRIRLDAQELQLLYRCTADCRYFNVHVRAMVAPYAFNNPQGRPFSDAMGVKEQNQELREQVKRVIEDNQYQWHNTMEWARQTVVGGKGEEGQRRMQDVT